MVYRPFILQPRFFILGGLGVAALSGCSISDVMDRPSIDVGSVTQSVAVAPNPTPQRAFPSFEPVQFPLQQPNSTQNMQARLASTSIPAQSYNDPLIQAAAQADPLANRTMVTPNHTSQGIILGSQPQFLSVPEETVEQEPTTPVMDDGPLITQRMPPATLGSNVASEPAPKKGFFTQMASMTSRILPGFGGGSSASDSACMRELRSLGVDFQNINTVGNPGNNRCGIANPVRVSGLSGGIKVKPAATLNCQMALAFAKWVKQDAAPQARRTYLSGIDTVHQMSSYSCRTIGNRRGGTKSEHSFGNAIDIGKLTLNSGKEVIVKKPGFFALRDSSMLKKIRADACKKFTTVLGPGYNADHADHFHFDLMDRNRNTCK